MNLYEKRIPANLPPPRELMNVTHYRQKPGLQVTPVTFRSHYLRSPSPGER